MTTTREPAPPVSLARRGDRPASASKSSTAREPDPRTLWVALEWIEHHCVVPDGFRKGDPFTLYRYQGEYLQNFYLVRGDAVWEPTSPVLGPAFVYGRGLLVGPQKVGKNPLIAAQVCLEGVGPALFAGWARRNDGWACVDHGCHCGWEYPYEPGDPMGMAWPTPLIQITAFSQDSTDNTYDALRPMIAEGPLADVIPASGEEFIRLPGGGEITTVTSSNQSRLGARSTFVPQDEVGLWTPQAKMVKLAETQYRNLAGMGGRASLTTNAWDPAEQSVAQQEFESPATDVYRQFVEPPKHLSYGDRQDRRRIHRIVYPEDVRRENGGHLDLDGSIEPEAARIAEHDQPQAMRFFGNILVAGAGHAVDPDRWDALARTPGEKPPAQTRIGAGFDGSISQDATIIRGCTPGGHSFLWRAWEKLTGPELQRWLAGHPGKLAWEVDRLEVDAAVDELFATYDVGLMECDTPKWRTEIEVWALRHGPERVVALDTNQTRRFAPVVDRWLTEIAAGTHTHDADPITDAHVKAAHRKKVRLADAEDDGRTMYVLVKGSDKRRIDGAVTDALALDAAKTMPPAAEVVATIYEREGGGVVFVDFDD